ncbi:MAG TPA: LysR family transcriptional regulator [Burkholderiaceae bacterium]|nr:LysR family transcriptional regulator [Burkholderiaceae bacterium]
MLLKEIDLNLLVVFHQLMLQRRVARVAEHLGLSQPAVSNALARLRKLLDDPLFTRSPSGMQPTPRAEQLAAPVAQALEALHGALNQRSSFAPAASERTFTVGMTDIGEIYFLPRLMDALAQASPGVAVSTVRNAAIRLKEEMEAGHVDLAIGLLPQLKGGFFQRRLFTQRYVCLFRRGHALDKKRVSLREFSAAEHVVVVSEGTGHGRVDELLRRTGVRRTVRLTVPHFVAVGHILQHTDMVATVPERLAQVLVEPFGLAVAAHPARLPQIGIHVFWHARMHRDPSNQWLRSLVVETFAD